MTRDSKIISTSDAARFAEQFETTNPGVRRSSKLATRPIQPLVRDNDAIVKDQLRRRHNERRRDLAAKSVFVSAGIVTGVEASSVQGSVTIEMICWILRVDPALFVKLGTATMTLLHGAVNVMADRGLYPINE